MNFSNSFHKCFSGIHSSMNMITVCFATLGFTKKGQTYLVELANRNFAFK